MLAMVVFAAFFELGQWLRRPAAARVGVDPLLGDRTSLDPLFGFAPIAALGTWMVLSLYTPAPEPWYVPLLVIGVGGYVIGRARVWWAVRPGGNRAADASLALELTGFAGAAAVVLAL